MRYELAALFGVMLAIFGNCAAASTIYPTNDGFEEPDLGSGGNAYGYANQSGGSGPLNPTPGIPGWTFVGGSGVAANGSNFNVSVQPTVTSLIARPALQVRPAYCRAATAL